MLFFLYHHKIQVQSFFRHMTKTSRNKAYVCIRGVLTSNCFAGVRSALLNSSKLTFARATLQRCGVVYRSYASTTL